MDDGEGLEVSVDNILTAFCLAGPYATGKSNTAKLEHRWELTLGIIDRAVMESDRGIRLLELTNKLNQAEAELAELRKGQGGGIVSWPLP